jgi:hypothetical protein
MEIASANESKYIRLGPRFPPQQWGQSGTWPDWRQFDASRCKRIANIVKFTSGSRGRLRGPCLLEVCLSSVTYIDPSMVE